MAIFFKEGETKIRPGLYQRYENADFNPSISARDGLCAIPIQAKWGPLGKVVTNNSISDLTKNYGTGTYGTGYTVPAAEEMFKGGAVTVYTYRLGTGGAQATKELTTGLTVTAKYPGTMPISVAVQTKLGDSSKKQFQVYTGTTLVEKIDFTADGKTEGASLIEEAANSKYVTLTAETPPETVPVLAVASGALTGGEDPTVTNEDYSKAFAALEPYYYNTIALDVDDDDKLTLSLLLQAYLDSAYEMGKLGIAVVGEKTTVDFEKRLEHARSFDDYKVVYLGGGYMAGSENKDGVMAICRTAGYIASTPSNQGIVHKVIDGATDLLESLTYYQYEEAILSGMLMVSMSNDGEIWYDHGYNTRVSKEDKINDDGWKKIRRVKVRFEMFDRLDRALAPKVGRVSCDSDGVGDCIQTGQRILDAMANDEGKLAAGPSFIEDPENPFNVDSAWFIIDAYDIDSLEKIYLCYRFRYSQNS